MITSYIRRKLSGVSIQNKLLVINLSATTVALLFTLVMTVRSEYITSRDAAMESLMVHARMVGNNSTAAIILNDKKGAKKILRAFSESADVRKAILFDAAGISLARYYNDSSNTNSYIASAMEPYADTFGLGTYIQNSRLLIDDEIEITQDIYFDKKLIGRLIINADISHLYDDIAKYTINKASIALIGLLLALLLLIKLRKRIVQPIRELTQLMDTVTQHNDYSIRSENKSDDEIGVLSDNFNKMLAHIQLNDEKLAHELSEGSKVQVHLDKLAYYDVTTNLPNRHFFQERLNKAVERAVTTQEKMALLFLDLDNFKIVNDTLGHKVGDQLLRQASSRLSNVLRRGDYICRVGGDEFAIIIENIDEIDITHIIIDKCLEALSKPFVFGEHKFFIGVSIGASICPDDATTANNLLVNSDIAMYEAKVRGKNDYQFFSPEMNEAQSIRYQLESELRHAINKNQLELYYQPQISSDSGLLIGVEALMRWNHPEKGMIMPDRFIPIAENTGLILLIGEWLINTACEHGNLLSISGLDNTAITIAINISGLQIQEKSFVDKINKALDRSGMDPSLLEIELTESTLMEDSESVINKMKQLQNKGVNFSIDDFGTGYSSMSYLKSFPISKLKIDKSFIFGLPQSNEDMAITRAIIAMAHGLNLKVVAEGVEHKDQVELLRSHKCDVFQGYYFSKPLTFKALLELLNKGNKSDYSNNKLHVIKGGDNQ